MTGIIIVLPKIEEGKAVRNLLVRNGYQVIAVCASGAQALQKLDDLIDGIVICGYRMSDMLYSELHDCMPAGFEMLLLASERVLPEVLGENIMCLKMPLKVHDLLNTVELMINTIAYRHKKRKSKPRDRKPEEVAIINEAKGLLIARNNMTEEEAHRYIQKCSMDSSTSLVETAQMVLTMMR